MAVQRIAYVELYVDDHDEAVRYFTSALGFVHEAVSAGPGLTSTLLRQGAATLAVSSGRRAEPFLEAHGDGVADIALECADVPATMRAAMAAGAEPYGPLRVLGVGGLVHTLVERGSTRPGDREWGAPARRSPVNAPPHIVALDHVAACVRAGSLSAVSSFYAAAFGLERYSSERIALGDQAMDSVVLRDLAGEVTFTILEPDDACSPGQIDAFLERNAGPGVQHLAFRVGDIVPAVRDMRDNGVTFLTTPGAYYDALVERISGLREEIEGLRDANVLADRDEWGYLLQLFTSSPHQRDTLFYELVQRRGARGFGSANIKALYEAVERDRVTAR
ncbi:MAG: 4-hydroxyphenylpyruvate dioxygenase [Frankiaceae bacterium]